MAIGEFNASVYCLIIVFFKGLVHYLCDFNGLLKCFEQIQNTQITTKTKCTESSRRTSHEQNCTSSYATKSLRPRNMGWETLQTQVGYFTSPKSTRRKAERSCSPLRKKRRFTKSKIVSGGTPYKKSNKFDSTTKRTFISTGSLASKKTAKFQSKPWAHLNTPQQ